MRDGSSSFTYPIAALLFGTVTGVSAALLTESRERWRVMRDNDLLEREVRKRTAELRATQVEVVRRLAQAAESRDRDRRAHRANEPALL